MKKTIFSGVVAIISSLMLSFSALAASPTDLDNVGTTLPAASDTQTGQTPDPTAAPSAPATGTTPTPATDDGNATTSGYIDYSKLGPDGEDIEQATEMVAPVVKWVNIGIGVLTAILGTVLLASTALDLIYIVSPSFIRNIGSRSAAAAQNTGMGMGGMGMGGMGMGGGAAPVATGFASLISDDCRAALDECGAPGGVSPAPTAGMGGGMGMGMGGMGMGGMGMGMGGMGMGGMGAPAAAPATKKAVALCYLKKRIFTFVLIGVCAVTLTCTCFLDVGTKLGMWIVNMVKGI